MVMMLPPSVHQRRSRPRNRNQRIDADVMRNAEAFARGVDEVIFQLIRWRKSNAVHQHMQLAVLSLSVVKSLSISASSDTSHI